MIKYAMAIALTFCSTTCNAQSLCCWVYDLANCKDQVGPCNPNDSDANKIADCAAFAAEGHGGHYCGEFTTQQSGMPNLDYATAKGDCSLTFGYPGKMKIGTVTCGQTKSCTCNQLMGEDENSNEIWGCTHVVGVNFHANVIDRFGTYGNPATCGPGGT